MSLLARNSLFDVDRFFADARPRVASNEADVVFAPRVDVREAQDYYEITAELPGVKKDGIEVSVKDGVLTLQAESAQERSEEDQGRVIRRERRFGRFQRSFNLGSEVEESAIEASFADGVLTLKAPKVAEVQPESRRIEIH